MACYSKITNVRFEEKMLKLTFPVKDNDPNQFRYVEEPLSEYITSIKQEQRRLEELQDEEDVGGEKAAILTFIGLAYDKLGSYSLSIKYFEKLRSVGQELADRKIIGRAYTNLGCAHRKLGDLKKAFEYFEKSLALARDRDDQKAISKNLNNLANIFELRCEVSDAIACHEERLEIARRISDIDGICKSCSCLGGLYRVCGQLQKSIERYEELLEMLRTKLSKYRDRSTRLERNNS